MKRYRVTVVPKSSLFLGCDRGNRVVRHSFHYIPSTTIGGALNTRFYQIGRRDLVKRFRFGNLYPSTADEAALRSGVSMDDDTANVWIPAPRNLYYCPTCREDDGYLVEDFRPEKVLAELICPDCKARRRPEQGVVEAQLNGDRFEINPNKRKPASPTVGAQIVGRSELHRTTAAHVEGRLHQVELLQVRGLPFHGDVWVVDAAANVLRPGATFRLTIGGLRSRGCGRAELRVGDEITTAPTDEKTLLAETPLLPLPDGEVNGEPAFQATISTPYARVAVNERWAAKPLCSGKGLVSFLHTLAVGAALALDAGEDIALGERMYFYRLKGSKLTLYGFDLASCGGRDYSVDYSFAELWTLGYGRLRTLSSNGDKHTRKGEAHPSQG